MFSAFAAAAKATASSVKVTPVAPNVETPAIPQPKPASQPDRPSLAAYYGPTGPAETAGAGGLAGYLAGAKSRAEGAVPGDAPKLPGGGSGAVLAYTTYRGGAKMILDNSQLEELFTSGLLVVSVPIRVDSIQTGKKKKDKKAAAARPHNPPIDLTFVYDAATGNIAVQQPSAHLAPGLYPESFTMALLDAEARLSKKKLKKQNMTKDDVGVKEAVAELTEETNVVTYGPEFDFLPYYNSADDLAEVYVHGLVIAKLDLEAEGVPQYLSPSEQATTVAGDELDSSASSDSSVSDAGDDADAEVDAGVEL